MLFNLACDESDNDGGNGDDPTNGTPNGTKTPTPTTTTIDIPENLSSDETSSTDGAYELSWDEVTDATTYKLREGETELELSSATATTHNLTGKMTGSYNYQVQACNASGTCSDWTSAITVHVFRASAPTLALTETTDDTSSGEGTYSSTDGMYTLSWNTVTGAARYELREGSGTPDSATTRTRSITDKTTESYTYQVRACHTNTACTAWSSAITVNVFRASAPTLALTETTDDTSSGEGTYSSTDGAYTLSWDAVTDAASYELREDSGTPDSGTTRSRSVSSKTTGSYEYRVRACHTNGVCTAWSSAVTVNVFTASAPTNLMSDETSSTDGAYTLGWDAVTDAARYELQEDMLGLTLSSVDARTHSLSSKATGSYEYRVRACHTNTACTAWSSAITVNVFIASAPANLSSDETSSTDGAYTLSWDAVTGAASYELREDSGTPDSGTTRSRNVSSKTTGSYEYRVRACHTNTACTAWSSAITVNVFIASAPANLSSDETSSADGAYTLTWDAVTGATSYKLQEDMVGLTLSSVDARNHSLTGKATGTYVYRVQACYTNTLCTAWSSTETVNVFTASAPANLMSDETSSTDGAYTLSWDAVTDAASYELREDSGSSPLYSGAGRSHSISGKPDGSYSYQVRACHTNTACSDWSNSLSVLVYIDCTAKTSPQTSGFNYGTGSSTDPYLICNYTQLAKMRVNSAVSAPLTKHYKLGAHIDASASHSAGTRRSGMGTCTAYDGDSGSTNAGDAGHNDTCTGWVPVGDNTTAFTGSLQGHGYTIRNLYINIKTTTTHVGLFGQTGSGSLIQNVGLTDAFIRVDTASSRVGGLVGSSSGSLSNSYATGSVTGNGNNSHVGGLVGNSSGSITASYATGPATASITGNGDSSHVGGLVGNSSGSLSNSYATASVTGSGSSTPHVGGLVGTNSGSLSNSYATGSVTGGSSANTGGLVGNNASGGSISDSYAAGTVMTGSNVGGLVGNNSGSINDKNYFVDDDGTNGLGSGSCTATICIRAGSSGQTDAQRRTWLQDTLDESASGGMDWSTSHWKNFGDGMTTGVGYPLLKYAQATALSGDECDGTTGVACGVTIADCSDDSRTGIGTAASPYLICNYAQLNKIRDGLTAHYELVAHIDASASRSAGAQRDGGTGACTAYDSSIASGTAGHPEHGDTCTGWLPVANTTSTFFTGSLQGAGYEIRNLYINIETTTTRGGLFGQTGSASVIRNLGVTDAYIKVDTASSHVGSLVGRNWGSISNCYATGSVSGGSRAVIGGLVGNNSNGNININYATSSVSGGSRAVVGGLVGNNEGSLSNSYATGSVSGGSRSVVGGLVGNNRAGRNLSHSYATGSASGGSESNVGGLVGNNDGNLSNSYATGSASSSNLVGGLVGFCTVHGSISNSYATGFVSGSGSTVSAGGLVGENDGSISNSYNSGSFGGNTIRVGGLVGFNDEGSISGKNYFLYIYGTSSEDGVFNGSCSNNVCIRATGSTDTARRTWLQDTLDESTSNSARPAGLEWSSTHWSNFSGTGVGYPKLKYAQVATFCSNPTHTTKIACEDAGGVCSLGGGYTTKAACEGASGTWYQATWWLAEGDECGGTTAVTCGDTIPGQ